MLRTIRVRCSNELTDHIKNACHNKLWEVKLNGGKLHTALTFRASLAFCREYTFENFPFCNNGSSDTITYNYKNNNGNQSLTISLEEQQ